MNGVFFGPYFYWHGFCIWGIFWPIKFFGMGFAYRKFFVCKSHANIIGMIFAYEKFFTCKSHANFIGTIFAYFDRSIMGFWTVKILGHMGIHGWDFDRSNHHVLTGQNIGPYVGTMFAYLGIQIFGFWTVKIMWFVKILTVILGIQIFGFWGSKPRQNFDGLGFPYAPPWDWPLMQSVTAPPWKKNFSVENWLPLDPPPLLI